MVILPLLYVLTLFFGCPVDKNKDEKPKQSTCSCTILQSGRLSCCPPKHLLVSYLHGSLRITFLLMQHLVCIYSLWGTRVDERKSVKGINDFSRLPLLCVIALHDCFVDIQNLSVYCLLVLEIYLPVHVQPCVSKRRNL